MKSKPILLAATLALFTTSPTFANEPPYTDAKTEKAEAPPKKVESKKPAKEHSHAKEKTGIPMHEPASGASEAGEGMPKEKNRADPCLVDHEMPGCAKATNKNK